MNIGEFLDKIGDMPGISPIRFDLGYLAPGMLIPYVNGKDFALTYHGSIFMMMTCESWYEYLLPLVDTEQRLQYEGLEYSVSSDVILYVANNEHMKTDTIVDDVTYHEDEDLENGVVIVTTVFKPDSKRTHRRI